MEKSPYFLERCTIVVINATIKLIDSNVNGSNNSSANNNPQETDQSHANRADSSKFGTIYSPALSLAPVTSLTPPIIRNSIDSIWWSLRLMRSVPTEVLKNFANHLGSGLLALVR